jgi:hypothetical protein
MAVLLKRSQEESFGSERRSLGLCCGPVRLATQPGLIHVLNAGLSGIFFAVLQVDEGAVNRPCGQLRTSEFPVPPGRISWAAHSELSKVLEKER